MGKDFSVSDSCLSLYFRRGFYGQFMNPHNIANPFRGDVCFFAKATFPNLVPSRWGASTFLVWCISWMEKFGVSSNNWSALPKISIISFTRFIPSAKFVPCTQVRFLSIRFQRAGRPFKACATSHNRFFNLLLKEG